MRIVVFEGLSALPAGERFLDGEAAALMIGEGSLESAYLGMRPDEGQLAPGPLIVSALEADPPELSTHFHLAVLSIDEEGIVHEADAELDTSVLNRLKTRWLTLLKGHGKHHGLVWEKTGHLATQPARAMLGRPLLSGLPEGDGERELRRLIDDSVNILQESEANRRATDEGKRPANLLWPWGAGLRLPVPNLALARLAPAQVASRSWRLAGLSRLAGYRATAWFQNDAQDGSSDLRVIRLPEDPEEALYNIYRWKEAIEPDEVAVVLTNGKQATGLRTDRPSQGEPFDERLLEEDRRKPGLSTWIDAVWRSMGNPEGS